MNRPNLFLIGAMKSGTTTLNDYLGMHPEIYMSSVKEPGYFVEEFRTSDRDLAWYLSLFQETTGKRYYGEASTHYTKLPTYQGVAERIHSFEPDARLVYVMRHPFERTISHYWHAVRDVHLGRERRSIIQAVMQNREYVDYSHYAMQLKEFLRFFPSQSLYCITFESLVKDTDGEMSRLYQWLGLEPIRIPPESQRALNQRPENVQKVAGLGILNAVRYSAWWAPISRCIPERLRKAATATAYTDANVTLSAHEETQLAELLYGEYDYQGKIAELEVLLGRRFSEWPQP